MTQPVTMRLPGVLRMALPAFLLCWALYGSVGGTGGGEIADFAVITSNIGGFTDRKVKSESLRETLIKNWAAEMTKEIASHNHPVVVVISLQEVAAVEDYQSLDQITERYNQLEKTLTDNVDDQKKAALEKKLKRTPTVHDWAKEKETNADAKMQTAAKELTFAFRKTTTMDGRTVHVHQMTSTAAHKAIHQLYHALKGEYPYMEAFLDIVNERQEEYTGLGSILLISDRMLNDDECGHCSVRRRIFSISGEKLVQESPRNYGEKIKQEAGMPMPIIHGLHDGEAGDAAALRTGPTGLNALPQPQLSKNQHTYKHRFPADLLKSTAKMPERKGFLYEGLELVLPDKHLAEVEIVNVHNIPTYSNLLGMPESDELDVPEQTGPQEPNKEEHLYMRARHRALDIILKTLGDTIRDDGSPLVLLVGDFNSRLVLDRRILVNRCEVPIEEVHYRLVVASEEELKKHEKLLAKDGTLDVKGGYFLVDSRKWRDEDRNDDAKLALITEHKETKKNVEYYPAFHPLHARDFRKYDCELKAFYSYYAPGVAQEEQLEDFRSEQDDPFTFPMEAGDEVWDDEERKWTVTVEGMSTNRLAATPDLIIGLQKKMRNALCLIKKECGTLKSTFRVFATFVSDHRPKIGVLFFKRAKEAWTKWCAWIKQAVGKCVQPALCGCE